MTVLIAPQLMDLQKTSMLAKDKLRTATLRSISAGFKQIIVDSKKDSLTFDEEIVVIKKMIKQRTDSASQFNDAGRSDLEEKELSEIAILEEFLPKQMSEEELKKAVLDVVESFDEKPTIKQMGAVMAKLSHLKSQADMGKISQILKTLL